MFELYFIRGFDLDLEINMEESGWAKRERMGDMSV
jgi:hypothetical protein